MAVEKDWETCPDAYTAIALHCLLLSFRKLALRLESHGCRATVAGSRI